MRKVELSFKNMLEIKPEARLTTLERQMLQPSVDEFNKNYPVYTVDRFPYGALKIRLSDEFFNGMGRLIKWFGIEKAASVRVVFYGELKTSDDFMALMFMADCVRQSIGRLCFRLQTYGEFGYVEYQRQDRVAVDGDNISVNIVANILSNLDDYSVVCPHSNRLNSNSELSEHILAAKVIAESLNNPFIVAPDEGSIARTKSFCERTGLPYAGHINKVRNPVDGKLLGFELGEDFMEGYSSDVPPDYVLYDDICDGGGTFVAAAEILKKQFFNSVNLFVYHGLFTRGIDALHNIDSIWCTTVDDWKGSYSLIVQRVK